jgi:protein-tyrosine phosphatase
MFRGLGIRAVYDLRSDEERLLNPSPVASRQIAVESQVKRDEFKDGSAFREASDADRRLLDVYLAILRTGGPLFGELLSVLATPGKIPAVIHCAGGKDRAGLAAALLLSSLGVDRETVLEDYELTNHTVTTARVKEILELFVSAGMTHEAALAFIRAPRSVMAEALAWLDSEFGGVEGYLAGPGGVRPEVLGDLRESLLEQE